MAEGRVAQGKKPAKDALDFVRAVQHLGGYRGVKSFQRYGLLKRNGKAFFATALSRIAVSDTPQARWLDDLDRNGWLDRFRRFAQGDNTPKRFLSCRRQLEDTLFTYSGREPSKAEMQELIALLGDIQTALAGSTKARATQPGEGVSPIPRLSEQWIAASDDGTPAFRIAKALAGLGGVGEKRLPLRAQLFPVERERDAWFTPKAGESWRFCTGQQGRLIETLHVLLERRLWLADKLEMDDKPLRGVAGAQLSDLMAFLQSDAMDARIAALLPGLSLCAIPKDTNHSGGDIAIPAAFALLKLSLTPDSVLHPLGLLAEDQRLPVPAGMIAQLAAGNPGNRAVAAAWRRLRSSGIAPLFASSALPTLPSIDPLRACAALLIPLSYGATDALARSVTPDNPKPTSPDH